MSVRQVPCFQRFSRPAPSLAQYSYICPIRYLYIPYVGSQWPPGPVRWQTPRLACGMAANCPETPRPATFGPGLVVDSLRPLWNAYRRLALQLQAVSERPHGTSLGLRAIRNSMSISPGSRSITRLSSMLSSSGSSIRTITLRTKGGTRTYSSNGTHWRRRYILS